MRSSDRLVLATAVAVALSALTFRALTVDRSYLLLCWLLIGLIALVSAGMRRARLGSVAVLAAQLVLVVVFVLALAAQAPGAGASWLTRYPELWRQGIAHMQNQAAPMVPDDGVTVIFVTVVGLIMVLTDLLVSGLARPVWSIAPPLALYLVPAVGLGIDAGLLSFACIALGYLGILLAEGLNTTGRWTRGLSRDSADRAGAATPVVWRAGVLIGVPAVLVSLVLGQLVPTLSLNGFGFGPGNGSGGQLQLSDPTLDLRRNLNQPEERTVITYTSDRPGGLYLRMASLPELTSTGWHNVAMQLTEGNVIPTVPGVANPTAARRTTQIQVQGGFTSQYLPLPYAPSSFRAAGEWAYDPDSLVVISNAGGRSRNDAIRGLTYEATSIDLNPSLEELSGAVPGIPADSEVTGVVPGDLPPRIRELTEQVIADADATTAADKAAAIQGYLRSSRFTYSTEPLPGTGYQALENFLFEDRQGYCEQFAAAMAVMARSAGIPSRVAVGFLPGARDGNTWRVSIRDMHAWPELYFSGLGWVRFEPTPAVQTGSPPAWTLPSNDDPTDEPSASASAQPSASASAPSQAPSQAPTQAPTGSTSTTAADWVRPLAFSAGGLLVLLVLAAPATIRVRRRSRRLSGEGEPAEQVESAWAEIRDSVLDYGGSWPAGSPHTIGQRVGERLDPEESAEMGRVATLVERSRYARTVELDPDATDLPAMTTQIRRGLAAPRSGWRRAVAFVLPRSLLRRGLRPKGPKRPSIDEG